VKLVPTFALAWYHLGNAQLLQGDTNAARESFTMAVQLQPSFTIAKEALSKLR
jgi:TolA-binding protein